MAIQITVGDLTFNRPDLTLPRFSLDIDSGWWDGPDMDQDLHATVHEGSAVGWEMVRHRTIVCSGVVETASTTDLLAALATLKQAVPRYTESPFVVHEPAGARLAWVRPAPGNPRARPAGDRVAEFQLTLVAVDSRTYSADLHTDTFAGTTSLRLPNAGDAPAPVTVVVGDTGPYDRGLVGVNQAWGHFPAGAVLDGRTMTARTAGGDPLPVPVTWDWSQVAVAPGLEPFHVGQTGSTISYRDTWS